MLLEFSVKNFLSIKDEITLSMVATKDKSIDYNLTKFNKDNLLKSAAIYGPNGSGKTNILHAIYYATRLIIYSHNKQQGETFQIKPFILDKNYENEPSSFNLVFEINGIKYIYKFSLDKNKIHEETLWHYPPPYRRKRIIFSRDINASKVYNFPQDEKFQREIEGHTLDNMLYLSRSANMKYAKTAVIVDWFLKNKESMFPENFMLTDLRTKELLARDDDNKYKITDFISKADKSIIGIEMEENDVGDNFLNENNFLKILPKEVIDKVVEDARRKVKTIHSGIDEKGNKIQVRFELSEEAKGTRKMFRLSGSFIDALSNGQLLVIDEIETSLHPNLVRCLIETFNNPEYNKHGAQLIFTTHNTHLMHNTIMRRDQIWLTEKGDDQGTRLSSLCEFSIRPDENIEKGYLLGRYGAIPNIG